MNTKLHEFIPTSLNKLALLITKAEKRTRGMMLTSEHKHTMRKYRDCPFDS